MQTLRGLAVGVLLLGCGSASDSLVWEPAGLDTQSTGFLSSVWGSSKNDVFVVGGTDIAEIYHYDGQNWASMAPPTGVSQLAWVFGFGGQDVYAVGHNGSFVRYDGTIWSEVPTNTDIDLWGIWGSAPNDMWIVGGQGDPLILHYDGQAVVPVAIDPGENPMSAEALFKVWGIGERVFAVGGTVGENGLILEYDGSSWKNRSAGAAADDSFSALWGTSENNIVVVGGVVGSRIATFDGSSFSTSIPAAVGSELTPAGTRSIFMCQTDSAWVGGLGYIGRYDLKENAITTLQETSLEIHGLWSDCEGTVFAVGGVGAGIYSGEAWLGKR